MVVSELSQAEKQARLPKAAGGNLLAELRTRVLEPDALFLTELTNDLFSSLQTVVKNGVKRCSTDTGSCKRAVHLWPQAETGRARCQSLNAHKKQGHGVLACSGGYAPC